MVAEAGVLPTTGRRAREGLGAKTKRWRAFLAEIIMPNDWDRSAGSGDGSGGASSIGGGTGRELGPKSQQQQSQQPQQTQPQQQHQPKQQQPHHQPIQQQLQQPQQQQQLHHQQQKHNQEQELRRQRHIAKPKRLTAAAAAAAEAEAALWEGWEWDSTWGLRRTAPRRPGRRVDFSAAIELALAGVYADPTRPAVASGACPVGSGGGGGGRSGGGGGGGGSGRFCLNGNEIIGCERFLRESGGGGGLLPPFTSAWDVVVVWAVLGAVWGTVRREYRLVRRRRWGSLALFFVVKVAAGERG